jgi:hypothetical protein
MVNRDGELYVERPQSPDLLSFSAGRSRRPVEKDRGDVFAIAVAHRLIHPRDKPVGV